MRKRGLVVVLAQVLMGTLMVAQSAPPAGSDAEQIKKLMERIESLENRLKAVEGGAPKVEAPAVAAAPAAPVAAPAPTPPEPEPDKNEADMHHGGMFNGPHLNIKGFADVQYQNQRIPDPADPSAGPTNSFRIGTLDLFITSKISERASFLAEIAIEAGPDNNVGIDFERLLLQYRQNPYLNFDIGRYHTALGFYNANYHHGSWFQTTVDRPILFRWEDGGGPLPMHNTGVSVSGKVPGSGSLGLSYIAEVGDGRDYTNTGVQVVHDFTPGKAVDFGFQAQPDWMPGWRLGAGVYHDTPLLLSGLKFDQLLFTGHVVYQRDRDEFLNEVVWMKNRTNGVTTSLPGFYSQYSRRVGPVRPYTRFQYINASAGDPVSNITLGNWGHYRGLTTGVRYDFLEFAAFKAEWEGYKVGGSSLSSRLAAQIAFTF